MALFDLDHWHEILLTLRRNRLRTFLTACGVFWGVFMLVIMLGFGRGLEKAVTQDFGMLAYNAVFVRAQQTSKPYAGHRAGRPIALNWDDLEAVRQVPGVDMVVARNFVGGWGGRNRVTRRDKGENFGITGDDADYTRLESLNVTHGRFVNPLDLAERRKVAVIGSRVRQTLFDADEDPLGQEIKIGNLTFRVIGIHDTAASGGRADWLNGRIFLPRTTVARSFGAGDRIHVLAMLVAPDRLSTDVEAEVRALLRRRHQVDPDDQRAFGGFNRDKEFRKVNNLFLGIKGLSWIVGTLTLLAGAIGVSNIMMISVAERTREIGIRKAIGATPFTIISQIVLEATVLTGLSGYLGLVAGVGALELVGKIMAAMPSKGGQSFFAPPELELAKAVLAAVVLTIAGAFAGLAPARSAVSVKPVEALAHE